MAYALKLTGSVELPKPSPCRALILSQQLSVFSAKRTTIIAARSTESPGIYGPFPKLRKEGKVPFIPYIPAGEPNRSTVVQASMGLDSSGSDIIDLGVAYSDPLAIGPVIQAAATQSLAWDFDFGAIMPSLNEVVLQLPYPVPLFSNYSPILKLGVEKIMSIMNDAGVYGPRPPRDYDVFISYKRGDTLHPVSHLESALDRMGIKTFFDFTMDGGVQFWPTVERAIEQSESAVIVISPKYHFSPWCLDETVKILQCHKRWGLKVLPIFWDIDAKELREQSRLFVKNIGQDEKGFHLENPQKVLEWRKALRTLGMFNGWPVKNSLYRPEAEVIEDLVTRILKSLNRTEEPT